MAIVRFRAFGHSRSAAKIGEIGELWDVVLYCYPSRHDTELLKVRKALAGSIDRSTSRLSGDDCLRVRLLVATPETQEAVTRARRKLEADCRYTITHLEARLGHEDQFPARSWAGKRSLRQRAQMKTKLARHRRELAQVGRVRDPWHYLKRGTVCVSPPGGTR
ncbi:MAG: hypothetical protein V3U03_17470 [Myxococcota bacterium]